MNVRTDPVFPGRLAQQQTAVEDAIRLYEELCIAVTPLSTPRAVPNDIDDDQVIACALAAGVTLIVSGDSDLLALHPWREIQILNAAFDFNFNTPLSLRYRRYRSVRSGPRRELQMR